MFGNRKKKAEKEFTVDINRVVTPMLDMTFQLLFYFIINFKPAIEEGQLDLSLPSQEVAASSSTIDDSDDKPDEYIVAINSVLPQGSTSPTVYDYESVNFIRFQSKSETVSFPQDNLYESLKQKIESLPKTDSHLF